MPNNLSVNDIKAKVELVRAGVKQAASDAPPESLAAIDAAFDLLRQALLDFRGAAGAVQQLAGPPPEQQS